LAKGLDAYKRNDFQHAWIWFRQAADQGDARGQAILGAMYRDGEGVKRDYQQAVFWLQKAANQGFATAQDELGLIYVNGTGVPRDLGKAIEWSQKAAAQGYANAQIHLQYFQQAARGPSDDEIIRAVKDRINHDALEIITAEYAGVENLSTNPFGVFQAKSKIATSISLACSLNAPNERSACLEKAKAETLAERDGKIRKTQNSDASAQFVYSVREKTNYEGNYITFVKLRLSGTDRTFQWKLLLQFVKGAWVISEKEEKEIN
jgi:TPR repeat protein